MLEFGDPKKRVSEGVEKEDKVWLMVEMRMDPMRETSMVGREERKGKREEVLEGGRGRSVGVLGLERTKEMKSWAIVVEGMARRKEITT